MAEDRRLERVEDKIDKISDEISSINSTLSAQHVVLKDHIKRTGLNEISIARLEKHDTMLVGAFKLLAVAAAIAEIINLIRK